MRHHADDPAQRARAVERALRPFEHFDAVHVIEAQARIGRAVGDAAVAPVLPHGGLSRADEAGIGNPANEYLVAAGPQMRRHHAGQPGFDRGRSARGVGGRNILPINTLKPARIGTERDIAFGGGDHDFLWRRHGHRRWRGPWPRVVRRRAAGRGLRGARRGFDQVAGRGDFAGAQPGAAQHHRQSLLHRHRAIDRAHPHRRQPPVAKADACARLPGKIADRCLQRARRDLNARRRVARIGGRGDQRGKHGQAAKGANHRRASSSMRNHPARTARQAAARHGRTHPAAIPPRSAFR